MNAPLKRDEQIELMKNAVERHEKRMQKWMKDATVRSALARPAKGQKERSDYTRNDVTIARCG
ncbi:choline/carnitine O-acyltransferase [Mesorhizobium sp. B2-3-5]|uniref:choline/carnitine O-acyltransferase n=1 Tax=Mesorhizobium sp. B2-3-5 TaxID=2589958 RepID=UPI001126DC9F|nr:choline/carnitine O-acyltransferase [Mesorhizobium sp. B2-3-5]TPM27175.1 choline/carnitine O-acyltransferase [Mesorhizobium sp. B2-3-5]